MKEVGYGCSLWFCVNVILRRRCWHSWGKDVLTPLFSFFSPFLCLLGGQEYDLKWEHKFLLSHSQSILASTYLYLHYQAQPGGVLNSLPVLTMPSGGRTDPSPGGDTGLIKNKQFLCYLCILTGADYSEGQQGGVFWLQIPAPHIHTAHFNTMQLFHAQPTVMNL